MARRRRRELPKVDAEDFDEAVVRLHEALRKRSATTTDVPWQIASSVCRSQLEEAARDFLSDLGVKVVEDLHEREIVIG